jgi:hypothetical protein
MCLPVTVKAAADKKGEGRDLPVDEPIADFKDERMLRLFVVQKRMLFYRPPTAERYAV